MASAKLMRFDARARGCKNSSCRTANHCAGQSAISPNTSSAFPISPPPNQSTRSARLDFTPCCRRRRRGWSLCVGVRNSSNSASFCHPSPPKIYVPLPTRLSACQVAGPQHAISLPYGIGNFARAKTYPEQYTATLSVSSSDLVRAHRPNLFFCHGRNPITTSTRAASAGR